MRCEGYRRYPAMGIGGGTGKWEQCRNEAVYMITVIQDKEEESKEFPSCRHCSGEAERTEGITVYSKEQIIEKE